MFTSRSIVDKTWRTAAMADIFTKSKLSFKAIGVLAAIDTDGKLHVCIVKDGSIGLEEMIKMSDQLKTTFKRRKINIFLDNLRLHYMREFTDLAESRKQHLIYNAIVSSQYNPIERLWALAKRAFGRDIIASCDMDS
jgi:hypothetical protein